MVDLAGRFVPLVSSLAIVSEGSHVECSGLSRKEALRDGNEVTIRVMRPDDKERLVKAFLHLQPRTIRMRFFYAKKTLSDDDLRWLDDIGHGNHVGLVATFQADATNSSSPKAATRRLATPRR